MIKPFHFYIAQIKFDQNDQSKTRPVLIISFEGSDAFSAYRITSKFKNKSLYYQHYYYRIKRLDIAGLDKISYIDTTNYDILEKNQIIGKKPIGKLSNIDISALLEFLKTR